MSEELYQERPGMRSGSRCVAVAVPLLIGAAAQDPEVKKSVAQLDKATDDLDDVTGENTPATRPA